MSASTRDAFIAIFSAHTNKGKPLGEAEAARIFDTIAQIPCILCQGAPNMVGIFIPHDSVKFGGNDTQQRMCFYPLCTRCSQSPGCWERVDRKLVETSEALR